MEAGRSALSDEQLLAQAGRAWLTCKRDFWKFAKYLKTEDQQRKQIRPFPVPDSRYIVEGVNDGAAVYPHLDKLQKYINTVRFALILKSRRTFVTNMVAGDTFHQAFFSDRTLDESYFCPFGAQDKDTAMEILARITLMYKELPDWLKTINPLIEDNKLTLRWQLGGHLTAFSSNPKRYRSRGTSRCNADEFAFHPDSDEALPSILGTMLDGGQAIVLSTPNGKNNAFYRLCRGMVNPNIKPYHVHWKEIPGRDDAWKAKVMAELNWTEADWQREMEFSFETALGPLMIEGFDFNTHVRPLGTRFPEGVAIGVCSWDIGFECPAATLLYRNRNDQLIVHLAIAGHRPRGGFPTFIKEVREYRRMVFEHDNWVDITPHDTGTTSISDGKTYEELFNEQEIYPEILRDKNPGLGWELTRQLFGLRGDGLPGIIINEDGRYPMTVGDNPNPEYRNIILEGLQGGFTRRQKQTPDGVQYLDEPNRVHPFIDVFDALNGGVRYLAAESIPANTFDLSGETGKIHQPVI